MSGIPDSVLFHPANACVAVTGRQTLRDALRAMQQRGGNPDWFVVVDLGSAEGRQHYLAARISGLRARVAAEAPELIHTPLQDFGVPLAEAPAVDQDTPVNAAGDLAARSPAGLAVVTLTGLIVGIVTQQSLGAGAATPAATSRPAETSAVTPASPAPSQDAAANPRPAETSPGTLASAAPGGEAVTSQPATARRAGLGARALNVGRSLWSHPALRVLGFVIATLLPTIWFVRFNLFPALFPERAPVMTGEWNVAVAGFTPEGDNAISVDDAALIGAVFYNRLSADMEQLSKQADIAIQVWNPKQTGAVAGATPEERAAQAEALARTIKADLLVYGTVVRDGEALAVQPEFYIAAPQSGDIQEVVGQHAFGAPISVVAGQADLTAQLNLNRELARRSEALSLLTRGLSLYFAHAYDNALKLFQQANQDSLWASPQGREVAYLFEGNAAGRANLLDDAQKAFEKALEIEPEYARAYAGLAGVYYLRALAGVTANSFTPDLSALAQSTDLFQKAAAAKVQPLSADIPAKVAFGLAQIYLTRWWAGQDTLALARKEFQAVLDEFGDGQKNARIQELAAESHARLGLIERQDQNAGAAIDQFLAAIQWSTIPARRGLYWATVADLYDAQGQADEAAKANRNAISEYKTALPLTDQSETKAGYWAAIADRYQKLGNKGETVKALEQAIDLAPAGSKDRQAYQDRLAQLKQGQ